MQSILEQITDWLKSMIISGRKEQKENPRVH